MSSKKKKKEISKKKKIKNPDFLVSLEEKSSESTSLGFSKTSAYEFQNQIETQMLQSGGNK